VSYDRDRDRRPQPIAGPPEGGRSGEYRHPFRPDEWDQAPSTPFRPQGRPRPESQADGFASGERASGSSERGYRWLRGGEERFAGGPPMPESPGNVRDGYGEENYRDEWTPQGRHTPASPSDRGWFSRGPHAGRGPKGYRRSDERIRETVNEVLARDPDLDATNIDVRVQEGEVTLEGTVPNRWSKRLAEDLVQDMPGVRELHNRLRVEESGH
jgi:hypothetical protein